MASQLKINGPKYFGQSDDQRAGCFGKSRFEWRHKSQNVLEGQDGVDPLFDKRLARTLWHDDALIHGPFDVHKARQNLL